MTGIFANAQPKYAGLGIATFPFDATEEIKRGPWVSHYNRMGLRASKQMAIRFPDAPGLAAMAGERNKLTIIDIDERGAGGERLLADVQRQFGDSKVVVRTGSGGFHCYYRHNGEGRNIRPDPRKPIDLFGGFCPKTFRVAPGLIVDLVIMIIRAGIHNTPPLYRSFFEPKASNLFSPQGHKPY